MNPYARGAGDYRCSSVLSSSGLLHPRSGPDPARSRTAAGHPVTGGHRCRCRQRVAACPYVTYVIYSRQITANLKHAVPHRRCGCRSVCTFSVDDVQLDVFTETTKGPNHGDSLSLTGPCHRCPNVNKLREPTARFCLLLSVISS